MVRKYDASHGLALAACIILLHNPFAIYQSGFLFSFTALLAIIVYSSSAIRERKRCKNYICEEITIYNLPCFRIASGFLETVPDECVSAVMVSAFDGMVLL